MDYMPTEQGVTSVFASTSQSLADYRAGVRSAMVFTDQDRSAAKPVEPPVLGNGQFEAPKSGQPRTRKKDVK
jgi:hypothetical protein